RIEKRWAAPWKPGVPQLISYERLAEPDGEMCEWVPASALATLPEALQRAAPPPATGVGRAASSETATRPPLRTIRDPYLAYSSVAVDPIHEEVVLTDENLFNIAVYDR